MEYWNKKLNKKNKLRIGLVWSGSTGHKNDKNRSLPLKDLEPIVQLPFEFHSLQKEIREIAQNINLPTAKRPDSTGICFIGEVDIKDFLK